MLRVGLVNYGAGNLRSIINAFDHIGCETYLIDGSSDLAAVSHLVLPGVGAFAHCMEQLCESDMIPLLKEWAFVNRRPLLGICVGMQLMTQFSLEHGYNLGLSWLSGGVKPLDPSGREVRVPHVGWNDVRFVGNFGEFQCGESADFYFDHSFALFDVPTLERVGMCTHGQEFAAIVRQENLLAAQFHPEKSQDAGIKFLEGFLRMGGVC